MAYVSFYVNDLVLGNYPISRILIPFCHGRVDCMVSILVVQVCFCILNLSFIKEITVQRIDWRTLVDSNEAKIGINVYGVVNTYVYANEDKGRHKEMALGLLGPY